ncbi:MAG: LicD family protein [Gammaproteobacteria bacterium]|nr:LicD family protein [Gammaproteobacteria bacterium]
MDCEPRPSDYGLEPLHGVLLEIIEHLDALCREHGIQYYLAGGCALGAVRHGGFVPWDDDLDIMLTWDYYERLLSVLRRNLDTSRFYLQEGFTGEWPMYYAKVRRHGTHFKEAVNRGRKMHEGVFVDVFCLDPVSENSLIAWLQWFCARVLVANGLSQMSYHSENLKRKVGSNAARWMPDIFRKKLLAVVRSARYADAVYYANFFHKGGFRLNICAGAWLGQPDYVPFENLVLPVPASVDRYLEQRFGNYMQLPSEDERRRSGHAEWVIVEKKDGGDSF